MAQQLLLYLHTHWDREWYWSFGAYRTQLVQVVDAIVRMLETRELDNFMLDGQTCLLEDLEEMAPSLTARIKEQVEKHSLSIGPWYVLADQLLVGGESLTRNLRYGIKACSRFGKASLVGYCPDTFGHSADLPRILKGFAIDNAVVWRGVPQMTGGPLFLWQSPDGSEVLTSQLARGYYQTAFHENVSTEKLADYLLSFLGWQKNGPTWAESDELIETNFRSLTYSDELQASLVPVGGDHLRAAPAFKEQLKHALNLINSKAPTSTLETLLFEHNFEAHAISLETYFHDAQKKLTAELTPLQLVSGELRDNSTAFECERAYMLAGVLSTRLYLKRENRLMEHALLKKVEPIRAMMALANIIKYPHEELDHSWRLLLKNHPHDSICGCSIDEVHDEMQARTKSLAGQLNVLTRQAQEALTRHLAPAESEIRLALNNMDVLDPEHHGNASVVFNTTSSTISMPVKVRFARLKSKAAAYAGKEAGADTTIGVVSEENSNVEIDPAASLQIISQQDITEAFLELSGVPQFKNVELIEAYAYAANIPPFGLGKLSGLGSPLLPKSAEACKSKEAATAFNGLAIQNQTLTVYLDKKGQLIVKQKDGARDVTYKLGHNFVDTGDGGDTYNFDPLANDTPIEAELVDVRAGMAGPVVSSLIVDYEITLPVGLKEIGQLKHKGESLESPALIDFKRSSKTSKHKITTEVILKANVPMVFFETTFENKASDHRLEVLFNTGETLSHTTSENHYSLIERPLSKKAKLHPIYAQTAYVALGHEGALDRYPCQRFFMANNHCFFNTGLPEYGAAGNQVSITLLRAVSYLSRNRLRTRGGGAGPNIATPGANSLGLNQVSYGWAPLSGSDVSTHAYALAELYENPLTAFVVPDTDFERSSFFEIDNPTIKLMASFVESSDTAGHTSTNIFEHETDNSRDTMITLRLLNVSRSLQSCNILGAQRATLHRLDGTELSHVSNTFIQGRSAISINFEPNELVTVKISTLDK